jgi:hypothetical protein
MSRFVKRALALIAGTMTVIGLQAAPALARSGAGHTSKGHDSAIVGKLGVEGGAYPAGFRPTAGTVEVEFNLLPLVLVKAVGTSGKFDIKLSPGSYTVFGCGPGGSGDQCSQAQDIKLTGGEVVDIQLVWAHLP